LVGLGTSLKKAVPHFYAWSEEIQDFREIRFKVKDDGTMLVIAKGYLPDGGLSVCFGVGYGFAGGLLGIDATINGGHWKVDKPWRPTPVSTDSGG
jgi:hypothetical protein